jgi:hypothetical protein
LAIKKRRSVGDQELIPGGTQAPFKIVEALREDWVDEDADEHSVRVGILGKVISGPFEGTKVKDYLEVGVDEDTGEMYVSDASKIGELLEATNLFDEDFDTPEEIADLLLGAEFVGTVRQNKKKTLNRFQHHGFFPHVGPVDGDPSHHGDDETVEQYAADMEEAESKPESKTKGKGTRNLKAKQHAAEEAATAKSDEEISAEADAVIKTG